MKSIFSYSIITFLAVFVSCNKNTCSTDVLVIEDFDRDSLTGWIKEGNAFSTLPFKTEKLDSIYGYLFNKGMVNSNSNGPEATGRLISPEFIIQKNTYIFSLLAITVIILRIVTFA